MTTHPTAVELLEAVRLFLERIGPSLGDRDVFLARVAVNAVATVQREIVLGPHAEAAAEARLRGLLGPEGEAADLTARLCERLREGRIDDGDPRLFEHLRLSARDQVRIDQPNYSGLAAFEAVVRPADESERGSPQ